MAEISSDERVPTDNRRDAVVKAVMVTARDSAIGQVRGKAA